MNELLLIGLIHKDEAEVRAMTVNMHTYNRYRMLLDEIIMLKEELKHEQAMKKQEDIR